MSLAAKLIHSARQQKKLQIIVRPCLEEGHSIWHFQESGRESCPKAVHVPFNPRKEIADRAFHAAPMLRHVEVAAGAKHVGFAAWQGCQQLQMVKLPPSVIGKLGYGGVIHVDWLGLREGGEKSLQPSVICAHPLGVAFDLSKSESRIASVYNTEHELSKHDSLVLRGRLGFADSFLHGRLGGLLLKKLMEHAYSRQKTLDPCTKQALEAMKLRLELGRPVEISDKEVIQWYIYTDAAYVQSSKNGGLGAVILDCEGKCDAWFGMSLDQEQCKKFWHRSSMSWNYLQQCWLSGFGMIDSQTASSHGLEIMTLFAFLLSVDLAQVVGERP